MNLSILKIILIFGCLVMSFTLSGVESVLILNAENGLNKPARNFRWASKEYGDWVKDPPSRKGLNDLRMSGSGQFSEDAIEIMHKKVGSPSKFYVVDLREECHGFVNGNAVSWYVPKNWSNIGKTPTEIESLELEFLNKLKGQSEVTAFIITKDDEGGIDSKKPFLIVPKIVQNESVLIKSNGWNYVRIPVTDHVKPTPAAIKIFLEFYKSLPSDGWVHFHCAAGDGRTTTFMALFDMLKNSNEVSFDEIIARQYALGGIDLYHFSRHKHWKKKLSEDRIDFLRDFYKFAKRYSTGNE